jgi:hypothetical protein
MKNYYIYLILLLAVLFGLANSGGRASDARAGNTGAPGDQTNGSNPVTCQFCHNSATIQVITQIQLLDGSGSPVTAYTPGETYRLRVQITPTQGNPTGYGFQLIPILDKNNTDAKGLQNPGSNVKIATVPATGRTYAEHRSVSNSPIFEIDWKAPANESGSVTFYASANGVNRNGGSSGDGAASTKLTVEENLGTSVYSPKKHIQYSIYPNPATDFIQLRTEDPGTYSALLLSADGKPAGKFEISGNQPARLPQLRPGTYTFILLRPTGEVLHSTSIMIYQ